MKTFFLFLWIAMALSACNGDDPDACSSPAESCEDLGGVCREPYDCGSACEAGEREVGGTCGSGVCCAPTERLCSEGYGECHDGACPEGLEAVDRICTSGGCVCCAEPNGDC